MRNRGRSSRRASNLDGKKILLVVTGGISAYKSAYLVRALKKSGAVVRVLMTDAAAEFVTPLTFEVLSGNPVPMDTFARRDKPQVEHVELASWPDRIIVAPATADFISKMALGAADDLPSTVLCAAKGEVWVAPAMNDGMWANPAVKRNVIVLERDGRVIVPPDSGELACGTSGSGRMAEPDDIVDALCESFGPGPLEGKRFLVTAGRTEEEIDPVRYLSNHSSGRMGFAIAERAKRLGASVTLVHGRVDVPVPDVDVVREALSAARMKTAVTRAFSTCDVLVMAAAVADYRPVKRNREKIKKNDAGISIELEKTVDILGSLKSKKRGQIVVGFALESEEGEENAGKKISGKGLDYLVLNMVGRDTGFASSTNQVTLYRGSKKLLTTPLVSKKEAAEAIIDMILPALEKRKKGK